jgi:hypothetical protein
MAGLALIAVGILCLSLSGAVARMGSWWQGTWQALGVGFIVGGLVDVLAISAMSRHATAYQRALQHAVNDHASKIVSDWRSGNFPSVTAESAKTFLERYGDELDRELRTQLTEIAGAPPPNAPRMENSTAPVGKIP